jgi:hypothetical protein
LISRPLVIHEYPYYRSRRGQLSVRSGWNAVRGNTRFWLGSDELKTIEDLSTRVDTFAEAWYTYQLERNSIESTLEPGSHWVNVMQMLESSQLSTLDAIRALSMIGRPAAGQALLRTMFETFLNILLLSIDKHDIARSCMSGKGAANLSKEDLAERFIKHAYHSYQRNMERFEEIWGDSIVDEDEQPFEMEDVQLLRTLGEQAREQYGFGPYSFYWHPFKSIWDIKKHLWPQGGNPRFNTQSVTMSEAAWDHYFETYYTFASHDCHGGPASLFSLLEDGPKRKWNHICLIEALELAENSIGTIAFAFECYDTYFAEMEARGLIDNT